MTIHQQIFARKRPIFSTLEPFGFSKTDGGFSFEKPFMDGDFALEFTISKDGSTSSTVIDQMNNEEYSQINAEGIIGGYVGDVRLAYQELLQSIADSCFEDVLFASNQANRITAKIGEIYGVVPDFPWDDEKYKQAGVFRHADSSKWFGLIMGIKRKLVDASAKDGEYVDVLNLKKSPSLSEPYPQGVLPAYHMNKKLWISVLLDDTMDDSAVLSLISARFLATKKN